ncbi:MAG: hypothetical protein B0A82_08940 [Alkalinema sp. CACIAM 70d]|nr:MAG: hypothetical protein B0A82_08940 [Alkalinema sp. CACIAM 70d]
MLKLFDKSKEREQTGKINAIYRSQAIIEFGIDGMILDANELFLSVMGYKIDDLRGKHHRIFVSDGEAQSGAYKEFWEKLRRGEFDTGQYKRIGKDGREVWIQASYNPIFDEQNKPYKVIKFAADITAQKLHDADFEGQVNAIRKSQAVIEFSLDGEVLDANENFHPCLATRSRKSKESITKFSSSARKSSLRNIKHSGRSCAEVSMTRAAMLASPSLAPRFGFKPATILFLMRPAVLIRL